MQKFERLKHPSTRRFERTGRNPATPISNHRTAIQTEQLNAITERNPDQHPLKATGQLIPNAIQTGNPDQQSPNSDQWAQNKIFTEIKPDITDKKTGKPSGKKAIKR